jgi:hypothetical protein
MIISRDLFNAALAVSRAETQYDPQNPDHEALLAAGIARVEPAPGDNGGSFIVLTHKGEEVIRLE